MADSCAPGSRPPRVLLIGGGGIGERHLRCFLATGRCAVAVAEVNPDRLAALRAAYGVDGGTDASTLLASGRFDAVVVATPAPLHLPFARLALEHGCHVLIEKPLALELDGIDALLSQARAANRTVAVGYVFRANPLFQAARRHLAERDLLRHIRLATIVSGQPFDLYRPDYTRTYYASPAQGGGAIQDAATHLADLLNWFLGPAQHVAAQAAHLVLPGVTVEDTVNLVSRHPGALASLSLNQFQAANELTATFHMPDRMVRIEAHLGRFGEYSRARPDWAWQTPAKVERDTPFVAQAAAFLDAADGRGPPLCTLDEGVAALHFQLAIRDSSRAHGAAERIPG
jgi:predicted dehydrogenase